MKALVDRVSRFEELNFLLTNRIPRRLATRFVGWWSPLRQPLVRDLSLFLFRFFCDDLELHEAKKARFDSLHDCFVRELKPGARPADPDPEVLTSPCDAIVGAHGRIEGTQVFQAKGFPYRLEDLFGGDPMAASFHDGSYVTLRLTSAMYHRFHAPHDATVEHVTYLSGDTWNVNPIALARVERLFCRNERVVLHAKLAADSAPVTLVAVAAILVASVRLHFLDVLLHLRYRGPNRIACDARFAKGEEIGFFQHGSTILVFVPPGFELCDGVKEGVRIKVGQPLLRRSSEGRG